MVVRMRHTRGHTRNRRSHHGLKVIRLSKCGDCGAMHMKHRACMQCGKYRGKQVIDVKKRIEKKQKKLAVRQKADKN